MTPGCRIELLGGLQVIRGGEVVTRFRSRKTAELLAYLACHRRHPHPREVLIELFWPEADLTAGRHSLNVALSSLRGLLEPAGVPWGSVLVSDRFAVGLHPGAVVTDVEELEAAAAAAASAGGPAQVAALEAAVRAYGGELLPGFYEDWILPEQQRLEDLFLQSLRCLVALLVESGAVERALPYALRAAGTSPIREEAHCDVMRLYAALGQPDRTLRQYRELEQRLQKELDAQPSPRTRELARELAAGGPAPGPAAPPPPVPVVRAGTTAGSSFPRPDLEPVGGAVPLGSRFYLERPVDREFAATVARRDCLLLLSGVRQVGKTSLLARGLQQARDAGVRVALTHFRLFNAAHLESADAFLLALAESLAEQLDLESPPAAAWDSRRGANPNFRRFLRREALAPPAGPLVWGLDDVDRLFACPFSGEVFGLFRSFHDERALEPDGPWSRLTLAMAYSSETHLFITDMNQSPFNVGTRVWVEDFTVSEVAELNERYGAPLRFGEVARFHALLGGHPGLSRQGLHEMARGMPLATFEARAADDDWVLGPHLRRLLVLLERDPDLLRAVRELLHGGSGPSPQHFYRLRSAGILAGDSAGRPSVRCPLYARYLKPRLP